MHLSEPDDKTVLDLYSEGIEATFAVFVRTRNAYFWPSYDGQKNLAKFAGI